jgi:molybdate transport system substrate-binding protein
MPRTFAFALILLAVAVGVIGWLAGRGRAEKSRELVVYCAAGLKKPVEELAGAYQRESGTAIRLQYGGSGTLLSAIRLARKGDLFLSADQATIDDARKFGTIAEVVPLVRQRAVVAVRSGNPRGIRSFADLLRKDVRVALANPEAAAIGRSVKAGLGERYAALTEHAAVQKLTVTEIAADVVLGAADAAVVWDNVVTQFPGTELVELPEFAAISESPAAAVLTDSAQPETALRFARYLATPESGGAVFKRHGFTLIPPNEPNRAPRP